MAADAVGDDHGSTAGDGMRNENSGDVAGNFAQVNNVHGDVNFYNMRADHATAPPVVTVGIDSTCYLVVDSDPPDRMLLSGYQISLLIEGVSPQAVSLLSLRPVVVARREPRPAYISALAASALPPRQFALDFTRSDEHLRSVEGNEVLHYVHSTDPEYFKVSVDSTCYEIDFRLELDWHCLGQTKTILVDHGGEPFRVHPGGENLREGFPARLRE